jgi:amino acid adenylation domain-containing protein
MHGDITRKIADVSRRYEKEHTYWLGKLSGDWQKSLFPYDPSVQSVQSVPSMPRDTAEYEISGNVYTRLIELSSGSLQTLHIVLAAALTMLLAKYNGSRDIVIGTPVYRQATVEEFVNTVLLLRNRIAQSTTFKDLLMQAKDTLLEAVQNQNYPVEKLAVELSAGRNETDGDFALFDVSLLLENIHDREYLSHIEHNLTFSFLKTETHIEGRVHYNAARYGEPYIRQILRHFNTLLETILFNLDVPFAEVNILSEEELNEYLRDYNDTTCEFPAEKTIHRLFEEQAQKTPDHIAVIDVVEAIHESPLQPDSGAQPASMTYSELNEQADRLANLLMGKGVGPETIVGIMLDRSIDMIVAILGILKAGAAYLPIDPSLPEERIDYMLKDSGAKVLVHGLDGSMVKWLEEFKEPASQPGNLQTRESTNLAYVIYTSGTTGRPKGVAIEHRGVVNYVTWAARTYVKGETLPFPLYTGIAFDLTVTSIFVPLITGNTIYIYRGEDREPLIAEVFKHNKAGIVKLTPAHLKLLGDTVAGGDSSIGRLILGGENLETAAARDIHQKKAGNIEIYNEYGPTETVVGSMIHRFDPAKDTGPSVSIGMPIANTCIFLLDPDLNPVPAGVPGEIYIGGAGIARGYLNNPELTTEKFVLARSSWLIAGRKNTPEEKRMPGGDSTSYELRATSYLYKTGDLAVRQADGTVHFLGRKDQQVKIRGFRVELGEIEHRLKQFKKQEHSVSVLEQSIPDPGEIERVVRCSRCLLSANQPGIRFDAEGVCSTCREYESYETHVKNYFKTPQDLEQLLESSRRPGDSYDCLLLFSGGKDSTYALYRLIDMGLKVLTFTFDNDYISEAAFDNIRRTTEALKVDHVTGTAEHMNRVFVESLTANHNVCHGCWHTLNTYGLKVAQQKGINMIVSGLSRGQIFDMRLHPLFQTGIFVEQEIEEKLLLFRKSFFSMENKFSRLLETEVDGDVIESVSFVDFFRYDATPVTEIKRYLIDNGWVQPEDTGFCSSNCRINDVGIYMYLKERNCHFYEAPLSWDIRLGQLTREAGLAETGFQPEPRQVDRVLQDIGYYRAAGIDDAVVLAKTAENGNTYLCGYVKGSGQLTAQELRRHLAEHLPDYMIPSYFVQLDRLPLSASGKVDRKALLEAETSGRRLSSGARYVAPEDEKEIVMADLFKEMLKLERLGIEDNFFELGATSFEIVQASNHLGQQWGRDLPVLKLFEYPTIASFLEYFNSGGEESRQQEEQEETRWNEDLDRGKARFAQRRKMRR